MARNFNQENEYCIETVDLTHKFSESERALNSVNLQVGEGTIYGFLGPNGAGKTTTLKLILGLLKKQSGEIRVFGKSFAEHRVKILKKTGTMIESPSIYSHLTAAENLEVFRKIYGSPKQRVAEVLELVGLSKTGSKKASQFSLGMKQRLGIAVALLHSPQLLILDEPTNGLDPNGILEIRELLRELNENHGITILISSHLLPEIERLVTHVGIINAGKLLFQGTLDELVSQRRRSSVTEFETSDNLKTQKVAESLGFETIHNNGKIVISRLEREQVARLNRELVQSGIEIYRIGKAENDLENIFFDVIGN
jgi:ABC-type multidrug transport system ATPase subunit